MREAASPAAFFVPLAVYIYSMQRFVGYWDVGEMQTVPYILGIAHPTGFPAFTLLGWLFSHAFVVGTVAWRMTLMCALAMSGAAWFVNRLVYDETGEPVIAMLCAWFFAFTDLAWTRGTRTEVHALAALFIAVTLYCSMRWARTQDTRWFYACALAWALAIGTHPVAALLAVGLFMVVVYRWETVPARTLAGAAAAFCIAVCVIYAYLPVRSAQVFHEQKDPTLRLGVAPGRPFWDYDHPAQWSGFVQLVSGSDFPVGAGLAAMFLPETYISHGSRYVTALTNNFTVPGVLLVLCGLVLFVRRAGLRAAGFIASGFFAVPFALGYPIESDIARYFLPSFIVCAVLAGVAVAALCKRRAPVRRLVVLGFASVVAVQAYLHSGLLGQRNDPGATGFVAFVRANTPSNAILMAPWTYATPLAYASYVEHSFGDRVVETAWLSDDIERMPRWMRTRPVYIVYLPWGDLPRGYELKRLPGGDPPVYRVLTTRR